MSVKALRKRSWAPDQLAVEQAQERPEGGVLCECETDRETSPLDAGPPLHEVEGKTEQRTVGRVRCEAAGEPDIGVVTTE
jgi:hypothetical protein